jgi:small subunit ribosomal protein S6
MKYEIMMILNPKQTDKELKTTMGEVEKALEENGFKVVDKDVWGARPLAYKLKGFTQAHYTILLVEGEAAGAPALQADFRIQSKILRFMMIKVDADYAITQYEYKAPKPKMSAHASELSKKVREKKTAPVEEVEAKEVTEANTAKLEEQLKAIESDADLEV